jgi:hypothetical protein
MQVLFITILNFLPYIPMAKTRGFTAIFGNHFFITGLVVCSKAYDHISRLQNGEAKIETVVVSDFDIKYYGRKLYEAEAEATLKGEKVKIIWDDETFNYYMGDAEPKYYPHKREKFMWIKDHIDQIGSDHTPIRIARVPWEDENTLVFLEVVSD